jgi:cell division protein FtsX
MFTILHRGIGRGLATLRREHNWATSFGALLGVFLLLQLLLLVLVGVEGMQTLLKSRTDLRIELQSTALNQEKQEFFSSLTELSFVEDTIYITKEQAYERTREKDPELIAFIEEFGLKNPFADTIGVTLRNLDDYGNFKGFIEQEKWKNILEPEFLTEITGQEKQVHELLSVARAGHSFTLLILALTLTAILFITIELTKKRALTRSDEVLVERLVGASPFSILLPFTVEATILFWGALVISSALLIGLISLIPSVIPAFETGGVLMELRDEVEPLLVTYLPKLILLEVILAPVIALLGAWMGIRPQVKNPTVTFAT